MEILLANHSVEKAQPFLEHRLHSLLQKNGWKGILEWYRLVKSPIHPSETSLVFKDNQFLFQSIQEIETPFLEKIFRKRFLLQKYAKNWRMLVFPVKKGNEKDLLLNSLPMDALRIIQNNTVFEFTPNDIVHIIKDALLLQEECVPSPSEPKNPYTNQVLNTLELMTMYKYLRSKNFKIPRILDFYRDCMFDMNQFKTKHQCFLRKQACLSCLQTMSIPDKQNFVLEFIYDCPSSICSPTQKLRYIRAQIAELYVEHFFFDTITIFRDYLYYFHYKLRNYHHLPNSKTKIIFDHLELCWKPDITE